MSWPRSQFSWARFRRRAPPVTEARTLRAMSDDALLWTHKPTARDRPRPGQFLWSFSKGDVTWTCALHFHGESVGWEAQILRDRELTIGRTFLPTERAVRWAEGERQELEIVGGLG